MERIMVCGKTLLWNAGHVGVRTGRREARSCGVTRLHFARLDRTVAYDGWFERIWRSLHVRYKDEA